MDERLLVGLDHLGAITRLLQRVRRAHPTEGTYQAAELQWWWSRPRSTDAFPQLFWFEGDEPIAAVTLTDFADGSSLVYEEPTLVVTVLPGSDAGWVDQVVERGLAHVAEHGIEDVELEIDRSDDALRDAFTARGFTSQGPAVVGCWLDTDAKPPISPLEDGYRLARRSELTDRPHHMARAGVTDLDDRLRETSLYRPDLDLVVLAGDGEPAAYGLFWHDPVTSTGVVEPMRTLDEHQRRGLARHVLTTGVHLLAETGARRIFLGYEPDNPASGDLYRSVGFVPTSETDLYAGRSS